MECITDCLTLDTLQIILDDTAQQDNIALRLWSPQKKKESGKGWITPEWNNACHFHTLIRSYPSGEKACYQFFQQTAEQIIQRKEIEWHKIQCPTTLYIFGWPIYNKEKSIIAILFGGLIRGKTSSLKHPLWNQLSSNLKSERAIPQELENEYRNITKIEKTKRKELFNKWKLFCQLLQESIINNQNIYPSEEKWIERLIAFHSSLGIMTDLAKVVNNGTRIQIEERNNIKNTIYNFKFINGRLIKVNNKIQTFRKKSLELNLNSEKNLKLKIEQDRINEKILETLSERFLQTIEKTSNERKKVLLERQTLIFDQVSKKSVANLSEMLVELFEQLKNTGVIYIDYASFSEVTYFNENQLDDTKDNKPCFSPTVVYPKTMWTKEQIDKIARMDLYAIDPVHQGSTAYSFQQSRSVIDRNVNESPTYIKTQNKVASSLVIPVKYGPLVLGVIAFDSKIKNYFNDARRLQLESLTQLLSPLIYHNRYQNLLDKLNKQIESQSKNINNNSINEIRKSILIVLARLIQAESASLWIEDNENRLLRKSSVGNLEKLPKVIDLEESALGKIYSGKDEHILIENFTSEEAKKFTFYKDFKKSNVSSYLAFSVKIGKQRMVTSFYRFNGVINRNFSEVELEITKRLGKILSFYETLNYIFDKQSQELQIQVNSREELAITLAHNIKSPLSSTYAKLDNLRRNIQIEFGKNTCSNTYSSMFDSIESNFSAIKRSTNSVLNQLLIKEKYSEGIFDIKPFHLYYDILAKLVSRARRGLLITGDSNNNTSETLKRAIEITGQKRFPLLYGDKDSIEGMIANLLENAIKYSDKGKTINIKVSFDYLENKINLAIENHGGIYIPAEDSERIFEYAYRSKVARDKDPSSTGVGLYYSKFIADKHDATLSLTSNKNPVCFKVSFPLNALDNFTSAEKTLLKNKQEL